MIPAHILSFIVLNVFNAGGEDSALGVVTLVPSKQIHREIRPDENHRYQVTMEKDAVCHLVVDQRDIDLVFTVIGPENERLLEIASVRGSGLLDQISFAAKRDGRQQISVAAPKRNTDRGEYFLRVVTVQSAAQNLARREEVASHEAAVRWVQNHAFRLKGVQPGVNFEDMLPLQDMIGDARIVAMGEATHGAREFFLFKHRLFEFLVLKMGFNTFAMEAPFGRGFLVNRFLLTGEGDPHDLAYGLGNRAWDTEEVLAMINWMRHYNADPRHRRKLKFYGIDMQQPPHSVLAVRDYLFQVDRPSSARLEEVLRPLADNFLCHDFQAAENVQIMRDFARSQLQNLDKNKAKYVAVTGRESWQLARQHARVILQFLDTNRSDITAWNLSRDRAMAENAAGIMDVEGPGTKMAIWAHNGRVADNPERMGGHLRARFGDGLIIFGAAFERGYFRAGDLDTLDLSLRSMYASPAPRESLAGTLAAANLGQAVVDFRPFRAMADNWFATPRPARSVGAYYSEKAEGRFFHHERIPTIYDAVYFIGNTTGSRPNPGEWTTVPLSRSAVNMGFEEGPIGSSPPGWTRHISRRNEAARIVTVETEPAEGRRCALISRMAGCGEETFSGLVQRLDAESLLGKRIRLQASVRTNGTEAGKGARLWLRTSINPTFPEESIYENMADQPIATEAWQTFNIELTVPESSTGISFGIVLTGRGQTWVDAVSLEEVR